MSDEYGWPEPHTVFGSMQRMFDEAELDAVPPKPGPGDQWMYVDGVRYEGEAMIEKIKEMGK